MSVVVTVLSTCSSHLLLNALLLRPQLVEFDDLRGDDSQEAILLLLESRMKRHEKHTTRDTVTIRRVRSLMSQLMLGLTECLTAG